MDQEHPSDGLICVLKTLEACKTAKVCGSDDGMLRLKSCSTKCLHYYLYYQDKDFGFMFVKIQTWFPFNIQVYINGRELMKSVFEKNSISYECYDNSFTDISDVAKAQELADKFDSAKLCRQLDAFAKSINPFLDTVYETFGQGYHWCVNQCEFATDVMFIPTGHLGNAVSSRISIHRWLGTHSTTSHAPMSLLLWGANRIRGFRERQSPTIKSVLLAAG